MGQYTLTPRQRPPIPIDWASMPDEVGISLDALAEAPPEQDTTPNEVLVYEEFQYE